jgi:hypothetical protein
MRVQHVHVHVLSRRCVSLADPKILHSLSRVPQSHAQPRPGWRPARDPISPGASGLRLRGSDRSSFVVGLRTAQPQRFTRHVMSVSHWHQLGRCMRGRSVGRRRNVTGALSGIIEVELVLVKVAKHDSDSPHYIKPDVRTRNYELGSLCYICRALLFFLDLRAGPITLITAAHLAPPLWTA